jgi:hypothetical protein
LGLYECVNQFLGIDDLPHYTGPGFINDLGVIERAVAVAG